MFDICLFHVKLTTQRNKNVCFSLSIETATELKIMPLFEYGLKVCTLKHFQYHTLHKVDLYLKIVQIW